MVVLIHLDALGTDYINSINTPFLDILAKKSIYGECRPTFGFEPDPAYWAGLYPDEAESGAQFCYDPINSPFKSLKIVPQVFNKLPELPEKIFRKTLSKILKKNNTSPVFGLPFIPFGMVHYFDFTFKIQIDSDKYLNEHRTVFKLLKENGKKYFIHALPDYSVNASAVLEHVEKDLTEEVDFVFLMIGNLDRIGHKYGPYSLEIKKELQSVDKIISKIFSIISERFGKIDFLVLGDHGMCEVNKLYDIQKDLKSTGFKIGKDYHYFIDSTMARFWFLNKNAEKIIIAKLNENKFGHILIKEEIDKYHLNYKNNKMGEFFFIVQPGVLLFPNFYQKHKPLKGMHGYLPEVIEQQSFFLLHTDSTNGSRKYVVPVDMRRVYPTVLKLLGFDDYKLLALESLI